MNVAAQNKGVSLHLNEVAFVSTLKKGSRAFVTGVEILGIAALETLHRLVQISHLSLKEEVEMIVHETIHKKAESICGYNFGQELKKSFPVLIIEKNRSLLNAAVEHMVEGSRILNSR